MFNYHMSYAELSAALNTIVLEERLLTDHEVRCIGKSLENPFLNAMLQEYPLLKSAQELLQKTLIRMEQEAAQRGHQNAVLIGVHNAAYAGPRERTKRYLQKQFPATKKPGLMEKLEEFVSEFLNLDKYPDVRKELELAELARDTERLEEFKKGNLSKYTPPKSIKEILEDFARYIPHLKSVYSTNTTFAWDVLESLFDRMDGLDNPEDKEAARNTLILALDDARAAYELLNGSYIAGTNFTCPQGLDERLLDHHQMIVADVKSNLNSNEEAVQILMSPFAKIDSQDIEHGGITRHIYTPLLYQLYAQAAGYRLQPQTKQIYKLKDSVKIEDVKQQYLNQFPNVRIKEMQEKIFNAAIASMKNNSLTVGEYDSNSVITFLNSLEVNPLEQQEHTEIELIAPENVKTEEDILNTMVAEGPFIDRAHLEIVLAWHDPKASTVTMSDSLEAGLEPSVTETMPSKESIISAYNSYVQNQLRLNPSCSLDFMNDTLEGVLMQEYLHDLPCTQTVLCEYLLAPSTALNQDKKEQLAVLCAKQGFGLALSILIKQGVNPNYKDRQERETLLHIAIQNNHAACFKALINAKADVNLKSDWTQTALMLAATHGKLEYVKALIDAGADVNAQDNNEYTALIWAAKNSQTECLKALIDAGANLNAQDNNEYTALMWAAKNSQTECLKALIDAGANLNVQTRFFGSTALLLAAWDGRTECLKALIDAGANLKLVGANYLSLLTYSDQTILTWAVVNGHTEYVRALINAGADLNWQDDDGNTALILAVSNWRTECVKALIAAGANPNLKNKKGETAMMIARMMIARETEKIHIISAIARGIVSESVKAIFTAKDDKTK
ncbi:MAG: hypothetical protein FJ161_03955, partial [Gammaproteobacteria bacterium]|nr:hypothetical protein [Gammaproteobacteria bacterium]